MSTQSVEVRLLGQKISLKSSGEAENVREVAAVVSERLKRAEARLKGNVPHHVALLALFELAEDWIEAKNRVQEHQGRVEAKSQELLALLETELK